MSQLFISELIRLRYKIYLYDYIYFKIIILWRKNELYNSYFISALFHLIFSVQKLVLQIRILHIQIHLSEMKVLV